MIIDVDFPAFIGLYIVIPVLLLIYFCNPTSKSNSNHTNILFKLFSIISCSSPGLGCIITLIVALTMHFKDATSTHCHVKKKDLFFSMKNLKKFSSSKNL